MKTMSIDLETFSDIDLKTCGVYKYAQSPNFEILLFAVSIDESPVTVYDLASGETLPEEIVDALVDDCVLKWAFNAAFERVCISAWLSKNYPEKFKSYSIPEDTVGAYLDPTSWRCSMIWCAYMGLPLSLDNVGKVLKLDQQKLKEGKDLIRYFSQPCKPTASNGGRIRNLPEHAPEKWQLFVEYNRRDVEVELSIQQKLSHFPVPDFIWEQYRIDMEINDRGIAVDKTLAENAIQFNEQCKSNIMSALKEKTQLDNPNSNTQMRQWLFEHGVYTENLDKKAVAELIKTVPPDVAEVLVLKQQISKSSVKKYQTMVQAACDDNRARGMFQFYGANRSGRWAGRLIQLQNLPQNHLPDLAAARSLVKCGDFELMDMLYENVPDTLSQLIRTAFVPRPGYKFIVCDFSAIEARVLSHIAEEEWRTTVFQEGRDIYCESASRMFHVPVEKHGQNAHLRQRGKVSELALGYGGSTGALISMGALDMGLAEHELPSLVQAWRCANPHIVDFWWAVDRAAFTAVQQRITTKTHGICFIYRSGMLHIVLPSGRQLCYVEPRIAPNRFGRDGIEYKGINNQKWTTIETYGPKLVENIVQAISRDILAYAMSTLQHCFMVAHIHDEIVFEVSKDVSVAAICEQMGRTPPWMPGLSLRADGYECDFYQKD